MKAVSHEDTPHVSRPPTILGPFVIKPCFRNQLSNRQKNTDFPFLDYSEKGIGDHLLANCCNHIVPCAEMTLCLILDLGDLGGKICRQKIWASPLQRQQHYLCFGFLELGISFFLWWWGVASFNQFQQSIYRNLGKVSRKKVALLLYFVQINILERF